MPSAGHFHTALLRTDGAFVVFGDDFVSRRKIPPAGEGLRYVQVAAGGCHTVLLRSNGTVMFWDVPEEGHGDSGWRDWPAQEEGVTFVQIAAGGGSTILLRSDGTIVASGGNLPEQCEIPVLEAGLTYTQVSAGTFHTVLLRSDGVAVACGSNVLGQCNIPALVGDLTYTQVAAGVNHTVLLRSDGTVVACGPSYSKVSIPTLDQELRYTQVAAGEGTVLLRSDGAVAACGLTYEIPALEEGLAYTQVDTGIGHTVLLRSDGTVVACGRYSQCQVPALRSWTDVFFRRAGLHYEINPALRPVTQATAIVFQSFFNGERLTLMTLSGTDVCQVRATASDRLADVRSKLVKELGERYATFDVVSSSGALMSRVLAEDTSVFMNQFC